MTKLNTRESLLATVRAIQEEIEIAIAAMPDESPPDREDWTLQDVIAHLTSWRLRTAARLEAPLHGGDPIMPWPAPLDEDEDLDKINHWFFETNRGKPREVIAHESRESFERVMRALAALPEDDLFSVGRFAWLPGHALGPAVTEGTLEHHREHESDIQTRVG